MLEKANWILVNHRAVMSWDKVGLTKLIAHHVICDIGYCTSVGVLHHKVELYNK